MATLTTGVVLLRWQLLSAVMMFLASTLNIRFRRADYVGLAVISSGLGRSFRLLVRNGVAWHHNGGYHRHLAQHRVGDGRRDESDTATMANDFDLICRSLHNGGFFFMAGRCFNHPP